MSRALRVDFNEPQARTHRAIASVWDKACGLVAALPWGRGVGKTEFTLLCMILMVALWERRPRIGASKPLRGVRIILMCPTFKQAKDLYAARLDAELGKDGRFGFLCARIDHTSWRIRFPGGSSIQLFGAVAWRSALGQRTDAVFVDECDDVEPDVLDTVVAPWFSEPFSLKLMVLSGTPRRGRKGSLYRAYGRAKHFLLQDDGAPFEGYFAHHATGYDVPHVDRAYLELQKTRVPRATFRREWLCDFDSAEALVYALFNQGFHVAEPHPDTRFSEHTGGIDWGWEHPSVLLVGGIFGSGLDAGVHLRDEFRSSHCPDEVLANKAVEMQERYSVRKWYADPSQPARIKFFKDRGIRIEVASNAVEPGIQFVQSKMVVRYDESSRREWSLFYVSPKCRGFIEEMGEYRRKTDARDPSVVLDDVVKKNDDSADACRYLVFSHLGADDGSGRRTAT